MLSLKYIAYLIKYAGCLFFCKSQVNKIGGRTGNDIKDASFECIMLYVGKFNAKTHSFITAKTEHKR